MGKWCLHASSFIFDRHKSSDEFDFGSLVSMAHLYVFWNEIWPWHIGLRWAIVALCATCFMFFLLQSGWSISMELVIGPEVGISYLTEKASKVRYIRQANPSGDEGGWSQGLVGIIYLIEDNLARFWWCTVTFIIHQRCLGLFGPNEEIEIHSFRSRWHKAWTLGATSLVSKDNIISIHPKEAMRNTWVVSCL